MAHQIASSVNCSLDEIDLGALKVLLCLHYVIDRELFHRIVNSEKLKHGCIPCVGWGPSGER